MDLAATLRKTHYVDMSGGFRDADTIASLYAAINRLLRVEAHPPPAKHVPVAEPSVPDKPIPPSATVRAAMIVGGFTLAAAVIAGIFGLWQSTFSGGGSATPANSGGHADSSHKYPCNSNGRFTGCYCLPH